MEVRTSHSVMQTAPHALRLTQALCLKTNQEKHMNIVEMAKCLSPWMQAETWHTSHPSDTKRFNNALNDVIQKQGVSWGYDEFKEAVLISLERHHKELVANEYMLEEVDRCASKAEIILTYVQDN